MLKWVVKVVKMHGRLKFTLPEARVVGDDARISDFTKTAQYK